MTDKERIEVYVNELPKTPEECPCQCDTFCNLHCVNEYGKEDYSAKNCFDMKDCPLKTIQSFQSAKTVEALEKVKEKFAYKHNSQLIVSSKHLVDYIDQLIKEYGGENE